jgi:hypothetical protein
MTTLSLPPTAPAQASEHWTFTGTGPMARDHSEAS